MPHWFSTLPDVVKLFFGFVLGILAKPLEQMTIGRWQKGRARQELYKRMANVFAITWLTLKSAADADAKQLQIEPQLKQLERIDIIDHDRFIERDKNLFLGDRDFIAYCNAIDLVKRAAKEDAPEKRETCRAIEETFLKAARLKYLDINLIEKFSDEVANTVLLEAIDAALGKGKEVKRNLETTHQGDK